MIIGLCGRIGSGKGTAADLLVSEHGFAKTSFADSLKDGVSAMFGWPRHLLEGDTTESREWREQIDEFWTRETGRTITPRLVLQEVGTDCMREGFYDGVWISLLKKRIQESPDTDWVISDVRFANEVDAVRELSGNVFEVLRGPAPEWLADFKAFGTKPQGVHESEWRYLEANIPDKIDNTGSLEDLKKTLEIVTQAY